MPPKRQSTAATTQVELVTHSVPTTFGIDIATLLLQICFIAIPIAINLPLDQIKYLGVAASFYWLLVNCYTHRIYEQDRARRSSDTSGAGLMLHALALLGGLPAAVHFQDSTLHRARTGSFQRAVGATLTLWAVFGVACLGFWVLNNGDAFLELPNACTVATLRLRMMAKHNVGAAGVAWVLECGVEIGLFQLCVRKCRYFSCSGQLVTSL